ncbi:MAG: DUF1501 domain-containing protein [Bryobacterales bacterium]|nr:DUF1501 domain-containing protein [Bryobacterales bacterium]MEB2359905.1 DUF1501 domain-containing protein [Bryobacterales bacterium]
MSIDNEIRLSMTRRHFFSRTATGIGTVALASLLNPKLFAKPGGLPDLPHFTPKAKSIIFLHQSGAPSQMELFDHKPLLQKLHGTELPDSIRRGQRITGMTSGQDSFPVAAPVYRFEQYGQAGAWVSELMPHTAKIVDDISIIKTVNTDAINHDPAITFIQTGSQQPGRPSLGSWVSYGLGSENEELPAFVVFVSQTSGLNIDQPLFSRLWSSGFLPSSHQGVNFRSAGDPVLYLSDPPGMRRETRRRMLDALEKLNQIRSAEYGDPEIQTRIGQYEMAFRMQTSVPDLMDLSNEPESTFEMYGPESRKPGSYAQHCLLARRLVERGVRFVQLYKRGWDQHNDLPRDIALQSKAVDQPSAALVRDLKQRGLLDQTLVIWGGEFGRTVYCQGKLTTTNYGRDHHPRCFAMWMAGGGIKAGVSLGETDDYCYNVVEDPVHVHDIQATVLHCLGIDHKRLTYKFQGRHFRLTDVHGELIKKILA